MKTPIPDDIFSLLLDLKVPTQGIEYIRESFEKVHHYPTGQGASSVRYPSICTGQVITTESRSFEYACVLHLHTDPDVGFILEQTKPLELVDSNGKRTSHTPDFLVIWKNRPPTLFEVKPASVVAKRVLKYPGRYKEVAPRKFEMPPSAKVAADLGFTFRLITEDNYEVVYLANAKMLDIYRRWDLEEPVTEEERSSVRSQVASCSGISMAEIECGTPARRADVVYRMIATGQLFTHLSDVPLQNQNRVALFVEPLRERAFATFNGENDFTPVAASAFPFVLKKGVKMVISQKLYTITDVAGSMVKFVNTKGEISEISVQSLIDSLPSIDGIHGAKKSMAERLRTLGPTGLSEFLRRLSLVLPYLPGGELFGKTSKSRSVRRYLRAYQVAKAQFGIGEYGLIPGTEDRGNYNSVIPADVLDCMERFVGKHYLKGSPRITVKKLHGRLKKLLLRLKMTYIPTYRTVARHCKEWDQNRRDLKRLGKRIAARTKVPFEGKSAMGSPHGVRPWETAHCDHTQNDVALDHPNPVKRLLKPWHSKMIDAVDGRALAWITRLEGPSTETVIMLLNDCVRRHGTLPSLIVVDWGSDFRSEWLQKTLAFLGITLLYRPKASGVSGSPVETNNREIDQRFIHVLTGSTEIMKRAREVSANMLPYKHAIWTLTDLIEQYERVYTTYNSTPDPIKKVSPNQMSENLSSYLGMHPRKCFHPEMLRRVLLPFVDKVTRKVSSKCTFVVGRKTYASDELRHVRGQEVEVRCDPSEPRMVFASHPSIKGLVDCCAVDSDLKYAQDANDAASIVALANSPDPAAQAQMDANWEADDAALVEKEAKLKAEKKRRSKPKKITEEPPAANVVSFGIPQGGLVPFGRREPAL